MTEATQHIVFSDYGAEILRAALAVAGRDERVIALPDDLRFGPIAPGDVGQRCSWCEAQFGAEGWQDVAAQTQEFWQAALGPGHNHVVWMSRRSVQDYTGFLEWLWRLGDAPCAVIDLTEVKVVHRDDAGRLSRPHFAVCLALLSGAQIIDGKLFDRAQPLAAEARRRERALWQKLREENAPLRVIAPDRTLISAPLSYFDAELMANADAGWRKVARVVGQTMGAYWDATIVNHHDAFLAARIRALVAEGRLQSQGDLMRMRYSEVRLPPS
jgi:hypothetical protein